MIHTFLTRIFHEEAPPVLSRTYRSYRSGKCQPKPTRSRRSFIVFRMLNPRHIPLLNPLQRQRRNKRGPNTTPILRRQNFNRVLLTRLLLRPVQNLSQSNSTALLEVRVFVEDGTVGANVAGFVTFLFADRGDAAGGEACGSRAD